MASFRLLRYGSRGPQVELLQLALSRAGFPTGSYDGIFGNRTTAALKNFQASRGLTADGIAGPATWRALTPYLTGFTSRAIRSGDTLYTIAASYGTTIRAIETANPGIDPLYLSVGNTLIIPLNFDVVPTEISFTSTVLELCVRGLKARYPFISIGSAGSSVMSKPLYFLTMGNGQNQVFYNGSHHANEWIVTPVLMKFLENYASAYAFDGTIGGNDADRLYRGATLYIIPMVNPDGVDLVTGEVSSGSYYNQAEQYAAEYPAIPFPSGWKANIRGVDLNLQYPAGWERAKEIKFAQGFVSPAPRDYVGPSPLSQPESRAVYDFTLNHNFSLTLSYHTQGEVIYWKYLDYMPVNSLEIARMFANVSGYAVEETPYESSFAGYKDWFIATYNRPGYTIEAGLGTAPLPLSQFDTIYSDNLGILTLGLTVTA